jgi:hypothetical protein
VADFDGFLYFVAAAGLNNWHLYKYDETGCRCQFICTPGYRPC